MLEGRFYKQITKNRSLTILL